MNKEKSSQMKYILSFTIQFLQVGKRFKTYYLINLKHVTISDGDSKLAAIFWHRYSRNTIYL